MSATWPTMEQVEQADVRQILAWNRFLPSPMNCDQIRVVNRIVERLAEAREQAPLDVVRASKAVGW